jgi:hypothetical protein
MSQRAETFLAIALVLAVVAAVLLAKYHFSLL